MVETNRVVATHGHASDRGNAADQVVGTAQVDALGQVVGTGRVDGTNRVDALGRVVETHRNASLQPGETTREYNHFGPQSRNIPAVVRGFKSAVKRWTNLYGFPFEWQSRYHDSILRDEDSLQRVRWYIRNNPGRWKSDIFYRGIR